MWSLPNIKSMNAQAAQSARSLKAQARYPHKHQCERCECFSRQTPAQRSFLVFDIFSDDPKDVLYLCEDCVGQNGDPWEGYFTCSECQRVMVENYTWERYQVDIDGESLCLKCAAARYFADEENWIDPKKVIQVIHSKESPLFDSQTGVLNPRRCRHVLGVEQPLPAGIKFVDNFEFDSMDGRQISGDDMLYTIQQLDQPFCLVMDAAYQFAVSVGLYVRCSATEMKEAA